MKRDRINDTQDHITKAAVAGSATNLVPAGSVLVVARSGILQHTLPVAVTEREVALNQDLKALAPDSNVNSEYLALALKAFEKEILGRCTKTGTTVQSLELPLFTKFEVPIAPIDDQQRIVAEIEKQFTRLEAGLVGLRRVQANLKRYRAAVLKAACEGKLVPNEVELAKAEGRKVETGAELLARILTERRKNWTGRGEYKEPAALNVSNLQLLPDGWTWATMDAIANIKGGITKDSKRKRKDSMRLVPYLRVANVQRGRLDLSEVKQIEATEEEIKELKLTAGDILFNEGGDRDKLGRGWVWNDELSECIHQNHVFRARLFLKEVSPKIVSWYGNTFGQRFFFEEGKHTTNLASISMTKLKQLPVPVPPVAEQQRIVAEVERRLSVSDELEAVVAANIQRATRLRQSILQRAFTGELA